MREVDYNGRKFVYISTAELNLLPENIPIFILTDNPYYSLPYNQLTNGNSSIAQSHAIPYLFNDYNPNNLSQSNLDSVNSYNHYLKITKNKEISSNPLGNCNAVSKPVYFEKDFEECEAIFYKKINYAQSNEYYLYDGDFVFGSKKLSDLELEFEKNVLGRRRKILSKCEWKPLTSEVDESTQYNLYDSKLSSRGVPQDIEVNHKINHPLRLHPSIWHNEKDELHDGPACNCLPKYKIGPLHNQFEGEDLPPCEVLRFNFLYDIHLIEEISPKSFTVGTLDLLTKYIFEDILELLDINWFPYGHSAETSCPVVHLMPRYFRHLKPYKKVDNSIEEVELLSASIILEHFYRESQKSLFQTSDGETISKMSSANWSEIIAPLRGTLALCPFKKPGAIRIDQMDRQSLTTDILPHQPKIIHMTYTPMKLSLIREPQYKILFKNFNKLQYLITNKKKISTNDREQLENLSHKLSQMEQSGIHRREITVELPLDGFYRSGIRTDLPLVALNLASLVSHIRFHKSLESLQNRIKYKFKDKTLLHQALSHSSFRRGNLGTNQDHFHSALVSVGPRILKYGDKTVLYKAWRKKGLTQMINVMSVLPKQKEERSTIFGNERLEFLGDAVIEILTSIHLYYMFPDFYEGQLDEYRQAIVRNYHLAELAIRIGLHKFILYTHSVDFLYDSTFIFTRSDAFEAVMAAIYLDSDLETVDKIFGAILFSDDPKIHSVWIDVPLHPLQAQYPQGDREFCDQLPMFNKLKILENNIGVKFRHMRILARSLTVRKSGYNFYTQGDNQRLEFLGDSLMKFVTTDYLYRHFPRHHEGHMSLLKNSLVNRYTQSLVCEELGLEAFILKKEDNLFSDMSMKELEISTMNQASSNNGSNYQNIKAKADLLEAFFGAIFVDKDLTWVELFCQVCFFPRLVEFILNQEWNDAKSKLQQCCLTYRSLNEDPELAQYKILDQSGSSNKRVYKVGVYFRSELLATGTGKSVHVAQMNAASSALQKHQDRFKQLEYQRSVIKKRYSEPFISSMLEKVDNWDSELIEQFIKKDSKLDHHDSYCNKLRQSKSQPTIKNDYDLVRESSLFNNLMRNKNIFNNEQSSKPNSSLTRTENDDGNSSCSSMDISSTEEYPLNIKIEDLRDTKKNCLFSQEFEEGEICDSD